MQGLKRLVMLGSEGRFPSDGSETLILSFVGGNLSSDYTLASNFLAQTNEVYETDPSAQGYVIIKVWS